MGDMVSTQVLVVGAGPVGLMLAGELRLSGARVVVVERLPRPTGESRASTLHARTMEIFADRGLLRRFGTLPTDVMGHFGGIPLDLTLPGPYPGQWKVPQTTTERILAEWAVSLGADLRRAHEMQGLTARVGHVEAEVAGSAERLRIRADYLVGCDGENSTVRRLAGLEFPGEAAGRELLRADVAGIDIPNRRFERLPRGLAIASRRADGVTRVMVHEFGRAPQRRAAPPAFAEVRRAWQRVTGEDIGSGTPLWVSAFDDACNQVTSYRQGRVLLAGDAAHRQMPVGGQALNLGLQDAANLGRKLAAVVCGQAPASLLDTYHAERHAVGQRVLANIRAQAVLLLGGPEVDSARAVVAELIGYEPVRRHLARMISGTDARDDAPGAGHSQPAEGAQGGAPREAGQGLVSPAFTISANRSGRMNRFEDKTALVTGASRGIGREIAKRLAEEGALVAVHYATGRSAAEEVVTAIEKDGGSAFAVQAEFGVPGDVHELFLGLERGLKERTGSTDLNILVNNAGVMGGMAPEDTTPERFDQLYAVNAKAPFFIIQRALGNLVPGGRIINVSSGLTRFANSSEIAYAMTKGAVEQLTLHFAQHLAPRGITVNSVAPGITRNGSPLFDMPDAVEQMARLSAFNQVGEPRYIADVVAFLASADARWVTGAFIDATGGTLLGA